MPEEILRNSENNTNEQPFKEIIGRYTFVDTTSLWKSYATPTYDTTKSDFRFYDNLRNGQAAGFRLAGLFVPTITTTITNHVWDEGISVKINDALMKKASKANIRYTNELLSRFVMAYMETFMIMTDDLYSLGDQYMVLNIDGSISVPSPDTVKCEYDAFDYRKPRAYEITTVTSAGILVDEFREHIRTLTIQINDSKNTQPVKIEFSNPLGVLPVVHFKNNARSNETNGRPIIEPCLRVLERFDTVLEKLLDGIELIINPIPTFEGLDDIDATIRANRTDEDGSYVDSQGNEQTRNVIHFDRQSAIFVGKNGSFKFAGPLVGFSSDALSTMKFLFQLIMNYSRLPEYVFGGAVSSSKASVETQQPPFNKFIRGRRIALEGNFEDPEVGSKARGGLRHVIDLFLRIKKLTDPRIVVGPVLITWPELAISDEQVQFNKVKWAKSENMLIPEKALDLLNLVEIPEDQIKEAEEYYAKLQEEQFQQKLNAALNNEVDLPEDNKSNNNNRDGNNVTNDE